MPIDFYSSQTFQSNYSEAKLRLHTRIYNNNFKGIKYESMGNAQASAEISLEEMERFEMEVHEDFNPSGDLTERAARRDFLKKRRVREAEELRQKYLGQQGRQNGQQIAPVAEPNRGHNVTRSTIVAQVKPRRRGRVTYVFQELEANEVENKPNGEQPEQVDQEVVIEKAARSNHSQAEEDDSLSKILQQKERIRSLITPGDNHKDKNKELDPGLDEKLLRNKDGRSPFDGAQFKVVSVNHKQQGADPVFKAIDGNKERVEGEQNAQANASSAPDKSEEEEEEQDQVKPIEEQAKLVEKKAEPTPDASEQPPKDTPLGNNFDFARQLKSAADERKNVQEQEGKSSSAANDSSKNASGDATPSGKNGRRSSWAFEPIPSSDQAAIIAPQVAPNSQEYPSALASKEVQAQVEIIPVQVDGEQVKLSPEELVDAERQRQMAEKMKGCPFFAGIKREDASKALKQHEHGIEERKASGQLPIINLQESSDTDQQRVISAAMNAFSEASDNSSPSDVAKSTPNSCPFSGNKSAAAASCPVKTEANQGSESMSLYDQFGGDSKMTLFVEDFMEGIMGDSELACYHQKFQDPYEMEMLKEKLVQFFKFKLDGSRFYIGKSMPEVHKNLGITDEVFDKACQVFTASVKKLKPKFKVMREFVSRIGGLRNQICFPPVIDDEIKGGDPADTENPSTLFLHLGQEIGLRNIVDSMLEQASVNNFDLFNAESRQIDSQQLVFKYSMFLASLLDTRYAWFHKDQERTGQLQTLLIAEEDLETMIGYFRTACVKNDVKKPVIVNFLDFLADHKADICLNAQAKPEGTIGNSQDPLIDSLEQQQKFDVFIQRLFNAIQQNKILIEQEVFQDQDSRQELVARITKILHCQNTEELDIDRSMLDNLPVNSDEPMFIVAECFRDTLIEIGVNEESAETARRTFLTLKCNKMELTQNKIRRIASRMSMGCQNVEQFSSLEESKSIGNNMISRSMTLKEKQKNSDAEGADNDSLNNGGKCLSDDGKPPALSLLASNFKYNLQDILPHVSDNQVDEEEMAKLKHFATMLSKKKNKIGGPVDQREENSVILQGPISKFLSKNHNIVKRYLILNKHALFVYKDEIALQSFPNRPNVVIPLDEIASVNQREFTAHQMLRNMKNQSLRPGEVAYVMEIALKQGYNQIAQQIANFQNKSVDGGKLNGQKKMQQKPQQRAESPADFEQGFIFVDTQKSVIQKWIKKTLAAHKSALAEFSDQGSDAASQVAPSNADSAQQAPKGSKRMIQA